MNIKVKLDAKITIYRCLLEEGEDFDLGDVLDNSHSMQSSQKTSTCKTVDGKVVSQVNNTKVLRG